MDGINKITARIAAEAREEIAALSAETAGKCRVIKEEYNAKAQEAYWNLIREGTNDCEVQIKRLAGTAEMEAKKSILAMKQEAVARVFDEAVERLAGLPADQYTAFLARQAANAASTGLEEIIFNARDRATIAKEVTKAANELLKKRGLMPKLTISSEIGSFKGGLIVRQGDIEVNCTAEKLVELSKSDLVTQIAGLLFAD